MKRILFLILFLTTLVYPQAYNFSGDSLGTLNGVDFWTSILNAPGEIGRQGGVARAHATTGTVGVIQWNQSFNKIDNPYFGAIPTAFPNYGSQYFRIFLGGNTGNYLVDTTGVYIRLEFSNASVDYIQIGWRSHPNSWDNQAETNTNWTIGDTLWVKNINNDSIQVFKNSTFIIGKTISYHKSTFKPQLYMDTTTWRISKWFINGTGTPVTPLNTPTLVSPADQTINNNFTHTHKWNKVTDATSYQFILSSSNIFTTTIWDTTLAAGNTDTSVVVDSVRFPTSFAGSTAYYWKVKALASGNSSSFSSTFMFQTRSAPAIDWCAGAYSYIPPTTLLYTADKTVGTDNIIPVWSGYDSCGITQVKVDTGTIGSSFSQLDNYSYVVKKKTTTQSFQSITIVADTLTFIFTAYDENGNSHKDTLTKYFTSAPSLWSTGYFYKDGWRQDRYSLGATAPNYFIDLTDYTAFTHFVVFSAEVDNVSPYYFRESHASYMTSVMEDGVYKMRDSVHRYGGKYLICLTVMGATIQTYWNDMITDTTKRHAFISYVAGKGGWMQQRGFDGIDLDIEIPVNSAGMLSWLREVRDTLRTWQTPLVTAAVFYPPPTWVQDNVGNGIDTLINQFNLMMYNFLNNGGDGVSSALRKPYATCPSYISWTWYGVSTTHSVAYWTTIIPRNKLGVLIAAECYRSFGRSTLCATGNSNFVTYKEVSTALAANPSGFSRVTDVGAGRSPYLGYVSAGTPFFYSWEDSISMYDKIQTIKDSGYGGVGVWDFQLGVIPGATDPNAWIHTYKNILGASTTTKPKPDTTTLSSPANAATEQVLGLTLKWRSVALNTSYYDLLTDTLANFSTAETHGLLTDTSHTITGLLYNHRYYWKVRAANSDSASAYTTAWYFNTIIEAPGIPVLISPSNNSINIPLTTSLQWGNVPEKEYYEILVSVDSSFSGIIPNLNTSNIFSNFSGSAGVKYYWKVRTKTLSGTSEYSIRWVFTTVDTPDVPVRVYPPTNEGNVPLSFNYRWNKVTYSNYYNFQLSSVRTFSSLLSSLTNITDTTLSVASSYTLSSNTKYYWRLSSANDAGASAWCAVDSFTTGSTTPPAPTSSEYQNNMYWIKVNGIWKSAFGTLPLTTSQRDSSGLPDGAIIYNVSTGKLNVKENGVWVVK